MYALEYKTLYSDMFYSVLLLHKITWCFWATHHSVPFFSEHAIYPDKYTYLFFIFCSGIHLYKIIFEIRKISVIIGLVGVKSKVLSG